MRNALFLLCALLFSGFLAVGQMYSKSVDVAKTISFNSNSGDVVGQQMITLLTSSFNGSTNGFRIQTQGTIRIEVSKSAESRYIMQIVFHRRSLTGDISFRGFQADSLLWPSLLKVQIQVFNGRHLRGEMEVICSTDESIQKRDITEFMAGRIGEFSIKVVGVEFQYEEFQYDKLSLWVDQVKTYYSFIKLLNAIEKRYRKYASDNQRSNVSIWIDRLELERMVLLLNDFDTDETKLFLKADPDGLFSLREKLIRFSQRAKTLFDQTIDLHKTLDENDVKDFCHQYVDLSRSYINQSKKLQPVDAITPMQMASVHQGDEELSILQTIMAYLGVLNVEFPMITSQQISAEFVKASNSFMDDDDFADALILLNNASVIHAWFQLSPDQDFEDKFIHAFDGVTSSYLKVGRMARVIGNPSLSELYLQRALDMIDEYQLVFKNMSSYDSVMPAFFSEVIQLCQLSDIQLDAEQKLVLLNKTKPLFEKFGTTWLIAFRQEYKNSCVLVFRKMLLTFEQRMLELQYPDAALAMYEADKFYAQCTSDLLEETLPMFQMSENLYGVYISQSSKLLEAGQPATALEQLELAKKIGNWLPPNAIAQIDSLTDGVAIPLIEDKISNIQFDIWALRLTEADIKLNKVDSIEQRYLDGKNPAILRLIRDTRLELDDRVCVAAQQKLDVSVNEIFTALRNRSYISAVKTLETIEMSNMCYKNCLLDTLNYFRVKQACLPVLSYLSEMNEVKSLLFSQGYDAAIDRYVKLKNFVSDNQLDTLGIYLPALYSFVGEQRLPLLTISTAEYYTARNQFDESLRYLWLAKDQKINKNELRTIMRKVAAGLAESDRSKNSVVEEALEKYTANDQYFSYFKFVYRKNRLL